MSFPRYPRYKDSGVEWLGEVPEHWEVRPVASFADVVNGYPFDSGLFDSGEGGFPLVRIRDLSQVHTETKYQGAFIERAAITSDDVLIGMDGDFNVGRWLGTGRALLNQRMCCVRANTPVRTRFLEYALPTPLRLINDVTYSTTVKHLSSSQVEKTRVALPRSEDEVRSVVFFLDAEVAKIDALIAEQQRLIELLKEKRQAVISSAVIPRDDEPTTKLRHLIEVTPGFAFPSDGFSEDGEGYRLLRGVNVGVGACRWDEIVYWAREIDARVNEYRLEVGDLVLGMDRPWISEGTRIARIHPSDLPALLVQRVARIRAKPGVFLEYIRIVLASQAFQRYLEADLTGVSVPHISERQIVSFPVRALSFDDQVKIAEDTISSTSVIDGLIAESERSITLLQERRTALISAAVTGKIDVRGLADRAA